MKAKKSPLILDNFFLLSHDYEFIEPEKNDVSEEFFKFYDIDIDFVFQEIEENIVQLFTKIGVNNVDNPIPGYSLFVEGVCVFVFDSTKKLTKKDKSNLLHFSGLNIIINNLRNIISNTTINGPFGRYLLPSIDVNKLLIDKQNMDK